MDVLIVRSSPFELPSQHRVDAIVHEGAADLQLWPGRGPDSDLREAWGEELQQALDAERERFAGGTVPLFQPVRVHPGRLHCDFLVWVPSRPPEPGSRREPALAAPGLARAVQAALDFIAERDVVRAAFPALGWGPGEAARIDRLEQIVRAAHGFFEERYREGRPAGIDQVLVCEPEGSVARELQRRVAAIARGVEPPPVQATDKSSGERSRAGSGRGRRRGPRKPTLDVQDLARARSAAEPYDMRRVYGSGDWLAHPRFGIGRVEQVTPEGAIVVLFEDGEQRKMVHAR